MAAYEYRCRSCASVFTVQRAMSDPSAAPRCPAGHDDVVRVFSAVAVTGRATAGAGLPAGGGGGCCGGACGCG